MRFFTLGFIICGITVQSQAGKFGSHFQERVNSHEDEILEAPESRFRTNEERGYPNYSNRIARKESDLPVTFKAPAYEERDYWKDNDDYSNRRTFFADFPRDGPVKPFQGLYQFMSSIFNGRDKITSEYPEVYHGYNHNRAAPPFVTHDTKFVTPFRFVPTEPNYIPPPKPIRASVIKLETITRSPIYSSFDYETTAKFYPPVKTILNQVLIENAKARQNVSRYPEELAAKIIPPFKPLPVLPKPEYVPPTTLKPNYVGFYNEDTPTAFGFYNRTDYKYPDSVQDQLPHINVGEVRIPYVSEEVDPEIFNSPPTDSAPGRFFPSPASTSTTNHFGLIDVRNLNFSGTNANRRERPINLDFVTSTAKSFPGAVEKVKRPTFKYTKKLTAQLDRGPVERVTNLTVLGYSKSEKANPRNQVNHLNMRDLINYEMDKLESSLSTKTPNNSTMRPVNLNDELSLDAKILKDTNWDGLAVPQTSTTEAPKEPTTTFKSSRRTESKQSKTAFWEIMEGQNTDLPFDSDATEATTTTTTEQIKHQTTTEFFWPSTPDINELVTTEEPTTRTLSGKAQRRSETLNQESPEPAPTENTGKIQTTSSFERTTAKRRYSRRPKIINFTPYPTGEELQKKLVNRNPFPKRQKPNITLSFGNKNVLKTRPNFGKEEVMQFSDEDVRKRRKIEKRRRVYKRIRVSTSERPIQDN